MKRFDISFASMNLDQIHRPCCFTRNLTGAGGSAKRPICLKVGLNRIINLQPKVLRRTFMTSLVFDPVLYRGMEDNNMAMDQEGLCLIH